MEINLMVFWGIMDMVEYSKNSLWDVIEIKIYIIINNLKF